MTGKTDFTAEEWESLTLGPISSGILVGLADPNALGMAHELLAFGKALGDMDVAGPAKELVEALVADMENRSEDEDGDLNPDEIKAKTPAWLKKAVATVDSKCEVDVAWGYKKWVLNLARATAEASKEGSFLGIGGVRVTEKEQEALLEIESILDI